MHRDGCTSNPVNQKGTILEMKFIGTTSPRWCIYGISGFNPEVFGLPQRTTQSSLEPVFYPAPNNYKVSIHTCKGLLPWVRRPGRGAGG